MTIRPRRNARLQLLVVALLFSTGGAAIKATALTGWQVASFRSGVAALVIWLLVPAARRGWSPRTWLVAVAYAATMVAFVVSNKLTTSANAIFLQSAAPLYILLLSPLLLRERVRARDLLFIVVIAAGLAFFFFGKQHAAVTAPDPRTGNLLAVGSGVFWAATIMGLRWIGANDSGGNTYPVVVAGNLLAFLACLPFALPVGATHATDWLVIGYLGVVQIGLAYFLLADAMRHVPAFEASALLLLEPALNPVWAWLVHGENPGLAAVTGGAIILAATLGRAFSESRAIVAPSPD